MKHLLLWTVLCLVFTGVLHAQNESVTEHVGPHVFSPRYTLGLCAV